MEIINLPTFVLEKYDGSLEKHKLYASMFEKDKDYHTYMEPFWSLENSVNYDIKQGKYAAIYFAYVDSELVGVVGLIWIMGIPELLMGILPEKRGRHYSRMLVEEYTKYVFDTYREYNELYAHVHDENTHSVENILAAGFTPLNDCMYYKKRY